VIARARFCIELKYERQATTLKSLLETFASVAVRMRIKNEVYIYWDPS
jgi:hypothetical protein